MASQPLTPSRRSKRFQPSAESNTDFSGNTTWGGQSYTRPANIDGDLLDDEREVWDELSEEDRPDPMTTVYTEINVTRGAQRGSRRTDETYHVGDTVLISTRRKTPSVAVIVSMWETRNLDHSSQAPRKKIRAHWFIRPTELAAIRAKREHAQNEIYYTLSGDAILSPESLIGHCNVDSGKGKSVAKKSTHAWSVSPSKRRMWKYDDESDSDEEGDPRFICTRAIDAQRGFYYAFAWKEFHQQRRSQDLEELSPEKAWVIMPRDIEKSRDRKRRSSVGRDRLDSASESGSEESGYEDGDAEEEEVSEIELSTSEGEPSSAEEVTDSDNEHATPRTPRKRKRIATLETPRKARKSGGVAPTPHSKAALKKRRKAKASSSRSPTKPPRKRSIKVKPSTFADAPPPNLSHLPQDPWVRAMHLLHVGSNPLLVQASADGSSRALPCREEEYKKILGCVSDLLEEGSGGCIYISGVPGTGKTATVHAVVRELKHMARNNDINPFTYVEINGLKLSEPTAAYGLLWEGVSNHDVQKEGHLRISSKEALKELMSHFSGGSRSRGPSGHACVVLMDELDQLVTNKQDVIYNFFNWPTLVDSQLVVIAVANTMDLPERHLNARVRSRLGMTRINFEPYKSPQLRIIVNARLASASATLELENDRKQTVIEPDAVGLASGKIGGISGDARRVLDICRRSLELVHPQKRAAKTADIHQVVKVMQNSPTAAYIRECSLHEQIMLASVIRCMKKTGIEEITWSQVQEQHCNYTSSLPNAEESHRSPTNAELNYVLDSLVAARALLLEDGPVVARKALGDRRIILNLEQGEVERELSEKKGNWANIFA